MSKKINSKNIAHFNASLRYDSPEIIIKFVLELANSPMVSTSFGPWSAALLHAVTDVKPDISVVWCDTGYNTTATYEHQRSLSEKLDLRLAIFTPKFTTAYLDHQLGRPTLGADEHAQFSESVKLEPFRRALATYQPDAWFSNIRKGQTLYRDSLDILSFTEAGILKVSPFYYFTDDELHSYMEKHDLKMQTNYFDPVKVSEKRECGIHLSS